MVFIVFNAFLPTLLGSVLLQPSLSSLMCLVYVYPVEIPNYLI